MGSFQDSTLRSNASIPNQSLPRVTHTCSYNKPPSSSTEQFHFQQITQPFYQNNIKTKGKNFYQKTIHIAMEEERSSSIDDAGPSSCTRVNLSRSRNFSTIFVSSLKETLFPDDPFSQFQEQTPLNKFFSTLKYYVPMLEWLPNYSLKLFKFDLLSGITIASLAIPQGISYAKLAELPPIIGLCTSMFGLYILSCTITV